MRVQNWWRINLAKIALSQKKEEKGERAKAAKLISSRWRGRTAKLSFLDQKKSSVLIGEEG